MAGLARVLQMEVPEGTILDEPDDWFGNLPRVRGADMEPYRNPDPPPRQGLRFPGGAFDALPEEHGYRAFVAPKEQEGPGRESYFSERVKANPYTGNETIDRGLRSMREDAIDSIHRPASWRSMLATALMGIRGGPIETGGWSSDIRDMGPMTLRQFGIDSEPLLYDSPGSIHERILGGIGPGIGNVWRLPEKYQRALDEGDARRASGVQLAGRDFPEKQFYELPLGMGMLPNPSRVTWEDIKGIQPLMMTGYYTGLPGTLRSSLLEQIPNALRRLVPARALEGLPAVSEEAPSQLRANAYPNP